MVICGGTYYTLLHTHYARAFHGVLYRQIIIQAGKADVHCIIEADTPADIPAVVPNHCKLRS